MPARPAAPGARGAFKGCSATLRGWARKARKHACTRAHTDCTCTTCMRGAWQRRGEHKSPAPLQINPCPGLPQPDTRHPNQQLGSADCSLSAPPLLNHHHHHQVEAGRPCGPSPGPCSMQLQPPPALQPPTPRPPSTTRALPHITRHARHPSNSAGCMQGAVAWLFPPPPPAHLRLLCVLLANHASHRHCDDDQRGRNNAQACMRTQARRWQPSMWATLPFYNAPHRLRRLVQMCVPSDAA